MYANFYGVRLNMERVLFYRANSLDLTVEFYSGKKDKDGKDTPFYSLHFDTMLELESEIKRIDIMVSVTYPEIHESKNSKLRVI